jgi:hypothetical protein
MKKISNENNLEESEAPEASVVSEEEANKNREKEEKNKENTAILLRSALKSASEGIAKGISADFASKRDTSSIFDDIHELVVAPLLLSMPGRQLERSIKGAAGLLETNNKVNQEAKTRLEQKIIAPSLQLYGSNFAPLISVLGKISYIKNLEPNDITNIEAMAIEFKGKDLAITNFSQESPYKIIIKQIIPILREKFDAVASFDQSLGPGAKIDHEGLSQDLLDGMEIEGDIAELERFYKAISEWRAVLVAFQDNSDNTRGVSSDSRKNKKTGDDEEGGSEEGGSEEGGSEEGGSEEGAIAENIYIHAVRPGQYVHRDPTGAGGLYINEHALNSDDTPVVKLYIRGESTDSVNSSGSGEAYLGHFINKGTISFPGVADLSQVLSQIIYNVTRESVSGGSEITIYFRPGGIKAIKGGSTERVEIMRVSSNRGNISVFADDVSQIEALKKISSADTTPYYQTISPSGEAVFFTPSDLVISGGSVKDSKGNEFKPKKIKGKSLSQIVTSKGFGKVRT